jgi:hypothetical protein
MTAPKGQCPQCGKPIAQAYRPFCSKRCADLDLHKWLTGGYAIPGADEEDSQEGPPSDKPSA